MKNKFLDLKESEKKLAYTFYKKLKSVLKWNKSGEIQYKGRTVENSNILDLISHAITQKKILPVGYRIFYKILKLSSFPNHLIVNKKGRKILER